MLQASQAADPDLRFVLVRAGGLQRVLIERAAAVGEEPTEAGGHHRAHLRTRQVGATRYAEDAAVGVVIADE